jgi:hypothetical protein
LAALGSASPARPFLDRCAIPVDDEHKRAALRTQTWTWLVVGAVFVAVALYGPFIAHAWLTYKLIAMQAIASKSVQITMP